MNADIAATLEEAGPEYAAMAGLLVSAPGVEPSRDYRAGLFPRRRFVRAFAAAASLFAVFALAAILRGTDGAAPLPEGACGEYMLAYLDGDGAAIREIVRSQRADGSWGSDFLTRQNAAALSGVKAADVAYRRALRYLRSKGLSPLSPGEMRHNGESAARMVKWQTQRT